MSVNESPSRVWSCGYGSPRVPLPRRLRPRLPRPPAATRGSRRPRPAWLPRPPRAPPRCRRPAADGCRRRRRRARSRPADAAPDAAEAAPAGEAPLAAALPAARRDSHAVAVDRDGDVAAFLVLLLDHDSGRLALGAGLGRLRRLGRRRRRDGHVFGRADRQVERRQLRQDFGADQEQHREQQEAHPGDADQPVAVGMEQLDRTGGELLPARAAGGSGGTRGGSGKGGEGVMGRRFQDCPHCTGPFRRHQRGCDQVRCRHDRLQARPTKPAPCGRSKASPWRLFRPARGAPADRRRRSRRLA